jgi:hypothetical protein
MPNSPPQALFSMSVRLNWRGHVHGRVVAEVGFFGRTVPTTTARKIGAETERGKSKRSTTGMVGITDHWR